MNWETKAKERNAAIDAFLATLELEYSATFVPQSQSRNANEKHRSLNWHVRIAKAGAHIATDYMQGIGHLPESEESLFKRYGHSRSIARDAYLRDVVETGKYGAVFADKKLPAPALRDVMWSLALDSDASDELFEDWCDNYGYDSDSRKALETYEQCRDIGLKLRRMIGAGNLATLRELFQDY